MSHSMTDLVEYQRWEKLLVEARRLKADLAARTAERDAALEQVEELSEELHGAYLDARTIDARARGILRANGLDEALMDPVDLEAEQAVEVS